MHVTGWMLWPTWFKWNIMLTLFSFLNHSLVVELQNSWGLLLMFYTSLATHTTQLSYYKDFWTETESWSSFYTQFSPECSPGLILTFAVIYICGDSAEVSLYWGKWFIFECLIIKTFAVWITAPTDCPWARNQSPPCVSEGIVDISPLGSCGYNRSLPLL